MVKELKHLLTTLGDRLSAQEVEQILKLTLKEKKEIVDCEGIHGSLIIHYKIFMQIIFRILHLAIWKYYSQLMHIKRLKISEQVEVQFYCLTLITKLLLEVCKINKDKLLECQCKTVKQHFVSILYHEMWGPQSRAKTKTCQKKAY